MDKERRRSAKRERERKELREGGAPLARIAADGSLPCCFARALLSKFYTYKVVIQHTSIQPLYTYTYYTYNMIYVHMYIYTYICCISLLLTLNANTPRSLFFSIQRENDIPGEAHNIL